MLAVLVVVTTERGEFIRVVTAPCKPRHAHALCALEKRHLMPETLNIPEFKSELEKAEWWDSPREELPS